MPTFQYRALQGNGSIAEGLLEAGGRQEAFRQMEGRGLRPISLTERGNGKAPAKPPRKNSSPTPAPPETAAPEKDMEAAQCERDGRGGCCG